MLTSYIDIVGHFLFLGNGSGCMNEVWKQIDDRYSVSNLGRIKSNYANKDRILKPFFNNDGYLMVDIRKPGHRKSVGVHRLVAQAFLPNPNNLPQVNHKDEDKTNNRVDNLEWCTLQYNCNYGTRNIRKGINCRKPICSVDGCGNVVRYGSRLEASNTTGISDTSISKALSENANHNKTAGGLLWFYDDGNVENMVKELGIKAKTNKRKVYSIDANGEIERYESASDAKRKTGVNNIIRAIKHGTKAGGKNWFYDD